MRPVPDFDKLVGLDVPSDERERLRRAHEALVTAGPPPELDPGLEQVPWPEEALAPLGLTRRRDRKRRSLLAFAAALAGVAFVAFLFGQSTGTSPQSIGDVAFVVKMKGTTLSPQALATIEVGRRGTAGNWPMVMSVRGLPPLQGGGYYDLWLSQGGKPIALCGSFNVNRGETVVRMSAAYEVGTFNGWVVTRHLPGEPDRGTTVYLTT